MDGRRRTIEIDEDVAVALEKRAALSGLTLDEHLAALAVGAGHDGLSVSSKEMTELDQRFADWERTREGVPLEEVLDWMNSWGKPDELPRPTARRL